MEGDGQGEWSVHAMVSLEEDHPSASRAAVATALLALVLLRAPPVLAWPVDMTHAVAYQLEVLQGLFAGPLSGWDAVLYSNPAKDASGIILRAFQALPALRDTPHVLVDLGSDGAVWSQEQSTAGLRGSQLVHVFVFEEDPRPFLEDVSLQWAPSYLILFSLANKVHLNVLEDEVFQNVENLVLLCPLTPMQPMAAPRMGLYTVFPFLEHRRVRFLGAWNPTFYSTHRDIFVDRFPSFEGHEFQLATWFIDRPFLYQKVGAPEGVGDGVVVEMLDSIARALNYSYAMTAESSDGMWGSFINGSWNGMLGMIARGEKNFTVNTMSLVLDRSQDFEAGLPYYMNGYSFGLLIPKPLAKWRGAYYPFMASVWVAVATTAVLAIIIMTIQDSIQPEPFLGGLGETWPYLLRLVVNHSLPSLPTAHWQRVFVGTWCLYCFIVCTSYTANLIAFLTVPAFPERIQTVHDLAESKYRVAMLDYGEFVPQALRTSLDSDYRSLSDKLDVLPEPNTLLALLEEGSHAILEIYSYLSIILPVDYHIYNTYLMQEQIFPTHQCWYFEKNAAWRHKFDGGIQRLLESGLVSYWIQVKTETILREEREKERKLAERAKDKKILTTEHLQGVFLLLLLGCILGFAVFTCELLHHQYTGNRTP